jgi:hypothetical protein
VSITRHLLLFIIGLSILTPGRVNAYDASPKTHLISPVYEEMLANQIHRLNRQLRGGEAIFHVRSWGEADIEGWRFAHEEDGGPFEGIVLVDATREAVNPIIDLGVIVEAGQFLAKQGNDGFLLIVANASFEREALEEPLLKEGLLILDQFPEWELEYVKDNSGRQVIDLDSAQAIERVYERLVREGMNPVGAWPKAVDLATEFRTRDDRTILVVGRT